jgi:hypothetical protein
MSWLLSKDAINQALGNCASAIFLEHTNPVGRLLYSPCHENPIDFSDKFAFMSLLASLLEESNSLQPEFVLSLFNQNKVLGYSC